MYVFFSKPEGHLLGCFLPYTTPSWEICAYQNTENFFYKIALSGTAKWARRERGEKSEKWGTALRSASALDH